MIIVCAFVCYRSSCNLSSTVQISTIQPFLFARLQKYHAIEKYHAYWKQGGFSQRAWTCHLVYRCMSPTHREQGIGCFDEDMSCTTTIDPTCTNSRPNRSQQASFRFEQAKQH